MAYDEGGAKCFIGMMAFSFRKTLEGEFSIDDSLFHLRGMLEAMCSCKDQGVEIVEALERTAEQL